jgi:hypothetical protein
MINTLKVGAIKIADCVNRLYDPFKTATFPRHSSLSDVALSFNKELEERFVVDGKFMYELPMPADEGDHALFQGLYTGYLALVGKPVDKAVYNIRALFINGDTLIRGHHQDGSINDTTSNDSATGVLFGLYCLHKYANRAADDLIVKWVQKICDSNYALTDMNGVATKYGKLEDGWRTDPLRITLLLALLSLASKIDCRFDERYEKLYNSYKPLLPYPKVKLLWLDTDYDTHRAAIHLHILWQLTHDTIYAKGLRRLHRISAKSSNCAVNVLCSPVVPDVDLSMLYTFNTAPRTTVEALNSGIVPTVKWGKKLRAVSPLPIYMRGSQEYHWQRNMFSVDEWKGNTVGNISHSNLDFLLVYGLAKRLGIAL